MKEIERKFLVKSDEYKTQAFDKLQIKQGFLNTHPGRTVRIRVFGNKGFLTVKGKAKEGSISRFEWEQEIPLSAANEMLELCEPGRIEKTRYLVQSGKHVVEVDEFHGENTGLLVAEIELENEQETFLKPAWLGQEVSGQTKYYNSQLSKNPFSQWEDSSR